MLEKDELLEATARLTPQWLAGFFDGEGSVFICQSPGMKNPQLRVSITQAEPVLLVLIATKFDIPCGPHHRPDPRSRKPKYEIVYNGKNAVPLLEYVKNHVILKRKQVELALEFAALILGKGFWRGNETPVDVSSKRVRIAKEIQELNRDDKSELYEELKKVLSSTGGAL